VTDFALCSWPIQRISEALAVLAQVVGAEAHLVTGGQKAPADLSREQLIAWVEASAHSLGLEPASFAVTYAEIELVLARAAPALLLLEHEQGQTAFLFLGQGGSRTVALLGPDGSVRRLPVTNVAQGLRQAVERRMAADVHPMLDMLRVESRRRARAEALLTADRMRDHPVALGFRLCHPPTASFWQDLKAARVAPKLSLLFLGYSLAYALTLLGWWFIGHDALAGRFDRGLLWAWALSVASLIPLRAYVNWLGFDISFSCAVLLKRRLFAGACEIDSQSVRQKGLGQLLSLVLESELLESLGIAGIIAGALAGIELVFAAALLLLGANDAQLAVLLIAWLVVSGALAFRFYQRKLLATHQRLALTGGLVETMLGQRTRLAQSPRAEWHLSEDATTAHYLRLLQRADEAAALLVSLVARGWLVLAASGLTIRLINQVALYELASAVGGSFLAYAALRSLGGALPQLGEALIAWREVRPLFQARSSGTRPAAPEEVAQASGSETASANQPILEAREFEYGYRERGKPALSGASLSLWSGDRVMLEGLFGQR
jgi:ATP-binding cassette subfamily B protein